MATIQRLKTIFSWFEKGKYPTQEQFQNTFFSFWHKHDNIPTSAIEELDELLNSKYDTQSGQILEQRMDKAEERLDHHDSDIAYLNNEVDKHAGRLDEHDTRLDKHEEWLMEHDQEFATHTAWQNRQDQHLADHDTRFQEVAEQFSEHAEELARHQAELDVHTGRLNGIDVELLDHENRLDTHQQELIHHQEILDDHETRITAAEGNIEDLKAADTVHDHRLDEAEQEIRNLHTKDTEQDTRMDQHKATLDKHEERISEAEQEITDLHAKDAEQDTRLDQHKATLDNHEERISEAEQEITGLHAKDAEQDTRLANHEERITQAEEEITGLHQQTGELREADTALRSDLGTLTLNLEQAVACFSVFEEAAGTASKEIQAIYTWLKSVYSIEASLTNSYQQVNTTHSSFTATLREVLAPKTVTATGIEKVKATYALFNEAVHGYHALHKEAENNYQASRLEKKQNRLTNQDGSINLVDNPDGTTLITTATVNIQRETTGGSKTLEVTSPVVSIQTTSQTLYNGFISLLPVIKLINNSELEVIYTLGDEDAGSNRILKDFGISPLILPPGCSIELFKTGAGWRITGVFGLTFFPDLTDAGREGDFVLKVNPNGTASTEEAANFIEVDESVTTDLDLETLDEMFPEAMSGFQFICPTSNTIYSKVSDLGGWIRYTTTKVASRQPESETL